VVHVPAARRVGAALDGAHVDPVEVDGVRGVDVADPNVPHGGLLDVVDVPTVLRAVTKLDPALRGVAVLEADIDRILARRTVVGMHLHLDVRCGRGAVRHDLEPVPGLQGQRVARREFEIIERRFINVWTEMETKFRKEGQKLDRDSTVKKMQLRDAAKKTIALR
jgi:hypothetical protein